MPDPARTVERLAGERRFAEVVAVARAARAGGALDADLQAALRSVAARLRRECQALASRRATESSAELRGLEGHLRALCELLGEDLYGRPAGASSGGQGPPPSVTGGPARRPGR